LERIGKRAIEVGLLITGRWSATRVEGWSIDGQHRLRGKNALAAGFRPDLQTDRWIPHFSGVVRRRGAWNSRLVIERAESMRRLGRTDQDPCPDTLSRSAFPDRSRPLQRNSSTRV